MKRKYNQTQTLFALNYLSNLAGLKKGTAEDLQAWMKKEVELMLKDQSVIQLIGDWNLVWGPVVVSEGKDLKNKVASNTMLVLKNLTDDTYVISVAGTNAPSRYGWFAEDFDVSTTVQWPYNDPNPDSTDYKPVLLDDPRRISKGTYTGLNILRTKMVSNGKTIQAWLSTVFDTAVRPAQVIVTGHSLGGALSATLALSLQNQQVYWDKNKMAVVSAMPTAGASPGNCAFSEYYGELLGTRTYRVWNNIDAIPNGWQNNTLLHVPWNYYPYYSPGLFIQSLVGAMVLSANSGANGSSLGGPYTQLLPETGPISGSVNLTMIHNLDTNAFRKIMTVIYKLLLAKPLKDWLVKIGIPEIVQKAIIAVIKLATETPFGEKLIEPVLDWIEKKLTEIKDFSNEKLQQMMKLLRFLTKELHNILVFVEQVLYQHTTAYTELFSIEQFSLIYKKYSDTYKAGEVPETPFEDLMDYYGDKLVEIAVKEVG